MGSHGHPLVKYTRNVSVGQASFNARTLNDEKHPSALCTFIPTSVSQRRRLLLSFSFLAKPHLLRNQYPRNRSGLGCHSLLWQTKLSLLHQTPKYINCESHTSKAATIWKRDSVVIFSSGWILANVKCCLITGHIHMHYLPDYCLVALGVVS